MIIIINYRRINKTTIPEIWDLIYGKRRS